ncbi:MAG: amidohydrolase [Geobacteraceae bacterium]|nr:amidohydrolase [Geobacteraceae bacterium]
MRFYDSHFHAMTLAHPNILAFMQRIHWQALLLASPLAPLAAFLGKKKIDRVMNLLSVMENDIGGFFMLVEYCLKSQGTVQDGKLIIGPGSYDTIVMTPLMMDFGDKNIRTETFYKIPPQKPIKQQVEDVFNGIAAYCASELVKVTKADGSDDYKVILRQSRPIFEIYPFLGLNTENYEDGPTVTRLLNKYFSGYRGCYDDFRANLGKFDGDLAAMGSNFFAGIKLYPPIGFDPWPDQSDKREKVEALYSFCCDKNIPVTTHCNDGGFVLVKDAEDFTNPARWEQVLEKYPRLKLNFAHLGSQSKKDYFFIKRHDWRDRIIALMGRFPNVHADISYVAQSDAYYQELKTLCNEHPILLERLLFGSDFMINLLDLESYNCYLELFRDTGYLNIAEKESLCRVNAERFLWGETQ